MCQPLEETCNVIQKYDIDIAYFAETNTNYNHSKARKQIHGKLRRL